MTTWTRGEVTRTTVEYHVPTYEPWGADWNQFQVALNTAIREWKDLNGERTPSDDAIRIHPGDDEIVISFYRDV